MADDDDAKAASNLDDQRCQQTLPVGATEVRCKLDRNHTDSHVFEIDGRRDAAESPTMPHALAS
jgi:hypothetical protein